MCSSFLLPVWKLEVVSEYQKGSSYIEEIPAAEQPLLSKDQSEHMEHKPVGSPWMSNIRGKAEIGKFIIMFIPGRSFLWLIGIWRKGDGSLSKVLTNLKSHRNSICGLQACCRNYCPLSIPQNTQHSKVRRS